MTDNEEIYLSVHREGDLFVVRDQFGRKVRHTRGVEVRALFDEVTEVTLTFLDSSVKSSKPHANRR